MQERHTKLLIRDGTKHGSPVQMPQYDLIFPPSTTVSKKPDSESHIMAKATLWKWAIEVRNHAAQALILVGNIEVRNAYSSPSSMEWYGALYRRMER